MKSVKLISSMVYLGVLLFSILYKNVLAPEDKSSIFFQIADMAIPLFMLLSMIFIAINRKAESKKKAKLSKEDREFFGSIGDNKD